MFQERRAFDFQTMNATSEYTWFNNKFAAGVDGRHGYGFGFPQTAIGSKAVLDETNFEAAKTKLASMKKSNGAAPSAPWPACWSSARATAAAQADQARVPRWRREQHLLQQRRDRGQPVPPAEIRADRSSDVTHPVGVELAAP